MVYIGVTIEADDDILFKKFTHTGIPCIDYVNKIIYYDRIPCALNRISFESHFPEAKIISIKQYYEEIEMP